MSQLPLVRALIASDTPALLWGAPGTGKTSALMAAAQEDGAHVEVLIGSIIDPTDVGGYLVPDSKGQVTASPPPWARRLRAALDRKQEAWLILDELSCAPPTVQAALLRVVQERKVGDIDLRGCRVVAAANPADTAADGGSISAATANRWAHIDWAVDHKAWIVGEISGWGMKAVSAKLAAARASIAGWISRKPSALLNVPTEAAAAEKAWPSPRSWSAAARAIAMAGDAMALMAASACVGSAAAAEWHEWKASADLPDPEDILAGRAQLPTRGDKAHASLSALVAAAGSEHVDREGRILTAWKILASQRPDLAVAPAAALIELSGGEIPEEASELGKRIQRVRS